MQRSMHETAVGFAHNKGIFLREYLLKALKKAGDLFRNGYRASSSDTDLANVMAEKGQQHNPYSD
jgi:hypothetical protein